MDTRERCGGGTGRADRSNVLGHAWIRSGAPAGIVRHMAAEQREIWHNPRCSKSRAAKAALDEAGIAYTERRYLDDPPGADELRDVLGGLGLEPWDITRTGENEAKELGMAEWSRTPADRDRWIEALARHPKLIQRPIVLTGPGRAVLARDEQSLKSIL